VIYKEEFPEDLICPICQKKMNLGVQQRCLQLTDEKIIPRKRKFKHLIPLVEVIANSVGVKSVSSSKVIRIFREIMSVFPSEIALWQSNDVDVLLDKRIEPKTINRILAVQRGDFRFDPPGYDGVYGQLKIM
jgi:PHP family Zn ribbon phosphoesterase